MNEYEQSGDVPSVPAPTQFYDPRALLADVVWVLLDHGLSPVLHGNDLETVREACAVTLRCLGIQPVRFQWSGGRHRPTKR